MNTGPFGQQPPTTTPRESAGVFGQPAGGSVFGTPSPFGQASSSPFGGPSTSGRTSFGSTFGSSTPGSAFGTSTFGTSAFGTNANENKSFGGVALSTTPFAGNGLSTPFGSTDGNNAFSSGITTPFGEKSRDASNGNNIFGRHQTGGTSEKAKMPFGGGEAGKSVFGGATTFETGGNSDAFGGAERHPFGSPSDTASPFATGGSAFGGPKAPAKVKSDTVRITGLPAQVDRNSIESALIRFGKLASVKITKKGLGYVKFQSVDSAQAATRGKVEIMGATVRLHLVTNSEQSTTQQFSIKVQPLPKECEDDDLRKALPSRGLVSLRVIKRDGRAMYGYANYATKRDADAAVTALQKSNLGKVQCSVRPTPAARNAQQHQDESNQEQFTQVEDEEILGNEEWEPDPDYVAEDDDLNAVQHKTVVFNQPKKEEPKESSLKRTVKISAGIGGDVDDERLKSAFSSFGSVVAASKSGGLVVFSDSKAAELAVDQLNGLNIFAQGALSCRVADSGANNSSPAKLKEAAKAQRAVRFSLPSEPKVVQRQQIPPLQKNDTVNLSPTAALVGACNQMCPEAEIAERVRFKELDAWEKPDNFESLDPSALIIAARSTAVKKYKRSDAGSVQNVPELVRPPKMLEATLNHLIQKVMSQQALVGEQSVESYLFLWDRLRAIRKDFILQNYTTGGLVDALVIRAFERMARFFIVMERRLADHPDWHDGIAHGKHNAESLSETLTALLAFYEMAYKRGNEEHISKREPEFTAYWLLFFADHEQGSAAAGLLTRLALERPRLHAAPAVVRAAELRSSRAEGNYARFIKTAKSAPYTVRCLVKALLLGDVRDHAFAVLSKAYSKTEKLRVELLQRRLCYDSAREAFVSSQNAGFTQVHEPDTTAPVVATGLIADLEEVAGRERLSLADVVLPSTRGAQAFYEENDETLGDAADLPLLPPVSLPSQSDISLQQQKEEEQERRLEEAKRAQEDALRRKQQAEAEAARRRQQEEEARRAAQLEAEGKRLEEEKQQRIKAEEARQMAEARRQAEIARRAREECERAAKKERDEARARQRAREAEARREAEAAQAAERERVRKETEAKMQKEVEEKRRRAKEIARELHNKKVAEHHFVSRAFLRFASRVRDRHTRRNLDAQRTAALWLQRWRSKTAGLRALRAGFSALVKAFAQDPGISRTSTWVQSEKKNKRPLILVQPDPQPIEVIHYRVSPVHADAFRRAMERVQDAHPDETLLVPRHDSIWQLSLLGGCGLPGGPEKCCFYADDASIQLVPGGKCRAAIAVIAADADLTLAVAGLSEHCTHLAIVLRDKKISIDSLRLVSSHIHSRSIATFAEINLSSAFEWLAMHTATPALILKVSVIELVQAALPNDYTSYSSQEACEVFNTAVRAVLDCASRMQPEKNEYTPLHFGYVEFSTRGNAHAFEEARLPDDWSDPIKFSTLLGRLEQILMPHWEPNIPADHFVQQLENDIPPALAEALINALLTPGPHSLAVIAAAQLHTFANDYFYVNLADPESLRRPSKPPRRHVQETTSRKRILPAQSQDVASSHNPQDEVLPPSKRRSLLLQRCRQLRDELQAKDREDARFERKLVCALRTGALRYSASISERFLPSLPPALSSP